MSLDETISWMCCLVKIGVWRSVKFDRAYKRHENSNEHVSACARLSCMGRIRVEHAINEGARIQVAKHNETVKQNRAFLNRLIDVTSLLGRQELSFRGHDESSESSNKGNYREFTETLAKYDSVLSTQFESSTVFSGMSHTIQNDLISALAATISDQIRDEIQDAPFLDGRWMKPLIYPAVSNSLSLFAMWIVQVKFRSASLDFLMFLGGEMLSPFLMF